MKLQCQQFCDGQINKDNQCELSSTHTQGYSLLQSHTNVATPKY